MGNGGTWPPPKLLGGLMEKIKRPQKSGRGWGRLGSGRPPGMCTQRISEFQAAMMESGRDREQWGRGWGVRGAAGNGGRTTVESWLHPPRWLRTLYVEEQEAGTQWKLCFYISAIPLWSHSRQVDSKWSCNLKTLQMRLQEWLISRCLRWDSGNMFTGRRSSKLP